MTRIVVVGGGIAGLSCAYELHKAGRQVTVVEKERLGGVIRTEEADGFLVEGGPDSFLTQKPWAKELCEEIGLGGRLIPMSSRGFHVWSEGELHPVPEGVFLTVPTKIGPFLESRLISFRGKLRMAMDWILPRGPDVEDESIGSFIRRRLGREALEKLAEPIMAGIHVASADELSLRCTFPRFADLEREHRSLIKALRRMPAAAGPTSPFLSLRGGMRELVDRLAERLKGATLLEGKEVLGIEPGWKVRLDDRVLDAGAVVLAVPTHAASRLWPGLPPMKYVTTQTVSLGYRGARVPEGTGFVIPRKEERKILACTWSSRKFEGRAPEGHLLIRCFIKGACERPVETAREELGAMLGLRDEPVVSRVYSWPDRNPVYEVGHERRMREAEAKLPAGLHLCGSGFHGAGIPDCIKDGRGVARKILERPESCPP